MILNAIVVGIISWKMALMCNPLSLHGLQNELIAIMSLRRLPCAREGFASWILILKLGKSKTDNSAALIGQQSRWIELLLWSASDAISHGIPVTWGFGEHRNKSSNISRKPQAEAITSHKFRGCFDSNRCEEVRKLLGNLGLESHMHSDNRPSRFAYRCSLLRSAKVVIFFVLYRHVYQHQRPIK